MPYSINPAFAWPKPAAGQEITITWSFADLDSVDRILGGGQAESFVTPGGSKISFSGYPDFSATISDAAMRDVVRSAFDAWDVHSGVNFVEVQDNVYSNVRLGIYATGSGLTNAGESSYGHTEMWKGNDFHEVALEINQNALSSLNILYNVVLHQIGHALGLDDTAGVFASNATDVMNPTVNPTTLSPDDIKGIQSLYGGEPPAPDYITQVARLYEAGFDRKFDAAGLNFWIDQREAGVSLSSMAAQFLDSSEFTLRFGDDDSMSNSAFVAQIYTNVLDRAPDASGLGFWVNTMNSGMTREQVLMNFSDSAENQAHSFYLAGLTQVHSGWWDLI